jgi:hypothetical protein
MDQPRQPFVVQRIVLGLRVNRVRRPRLNHPGSPLPLPNSALVTLSHSLSRSHENPP